MTRVLVKKASIIQPTTIKAAPQYEDYNDGRILVLLNTEMPQAIKKVALNTVLGITQEIFQTLPGLRSQAYKFQNSVRSLIKPYHDGEIKDSEVKADISKAWAEFRSAIHAERAKIAGVGTNKPPVKPVPKKGVLPAISDSNVTDEELTIEDEEDFLKKISDLEVRRQHPKTNEDEHKMLSSLYKDGMYSGQMSLIVISKPPLDINKLKALGFSAEMVGDYIALNRQMVVGVHAGALNEHVQELIQKRVAKVRKEKGDEAASQLAHRLKNKHLADAEAEDLSVLVDAVKARYASSNLTPIAGKGDHPVRYHGAAFYWMLPSKIYEMLKRCTISTGAVSSMNLSNWDFTFKVTR